MALKRKRDKVARLYIMFLFCDYKDRESPTPGLTVLLQVCSSEPESLMRPQSLHGLCTICIKRGGFLEPPFFAPFGKLLMKNPGCWLNQDLLFL